MQNIRQKKSYFLLILFIIISKVSTSQTVNNNIYFADSLYNVQKYTEAYKVYVHELQNSEMVSPKSLLKMARIKEGSKDFPEALYYLSLYYRILNDETVVPKILSISKQNNYQGWEYNDLNFIENKFQIYKHILIIGVLGLIIVFFIFMIIRKVKTENSPLLLILVVLLSVSVILIIEFSKEKQFGIIQNNNSLIMEAPTAGANLIEISSKGHKIELLKENDIWSEIIWNGQTRYIRSINVIPI